MEPLLFVGAAAVASLVLRAATARNATARNVATASPPAGGPPPTELAGRVLDASITKARSAG